MRDDLDEAIAAEEHRQGMAYGQEREHCGTRAGSRRNKRRRHA